MSAPPDRAAARCACTNISLMQLFHELKQKFPGAPDHAVSGAIAAYCHDKRACETHLESQAEASLTHAYHASSSAAARRLKDLRANLAPIECRNRSIEKRQFPSTATVRALPCEKPQHAELSSGVCLDDNSNNIDAVDATNTVCIENENNDKLSEAKNEVLQQQLEAPTPRVLSEESPITINIDNCVEKSGETPSDAETDDTNRGRSSTGDAERDPAADTNESTGSNYRILKSHKIKSNLNELERTKEKKAVKVKNVEKRPEETEPPAATAEGVSSEKPKRPCTLEFIKPQPDLNLKRQTIAEPAPEPCRAVSPLPPAPEPVAPPRKDRVAAQPVGTHWPDQGYPLNLSVNVNCHMDIANRPRTLYPDPWLEEYESPRAFTSVNLTVCTPTSAMQSPVREVSTGAGDQRGFEGHVTVTVSPSATRPPRRRAPPPPTPATAATHQQHFLPTPTLESAALSDGSLVARQRARKRLLVEELGRERERLARTARETAVLAAPLPPAAAARRLRQDVEWLREQCQRMTRALDAQNAGHERESDEYYTNLYTGGGERGGGAAGAAVPRAPSRPAPAPPGADDAPSWQCHVCTFRNHGLLNKCEECDMPRILLVRAGDEITVHLMPGPGRRKIVRSWVL